MGFTGKIFSYMGDIYAPASILPAVQAWDLRREIYFDRIGGLLVEEDHRHRAAASMASSVERLPCVAAAKRGD